jgi:cytochrome P450
MTTASPPTALDSGPRAPGALRGFDRWFVPHSFLRWTESAPERYVMKAPLAPKVLLTCSPEDCRAIFTERDGKLLFGEGLRRFAPHEAMFGHDALSALDGEDHTRFRRRLTGAFHGEALKGYERAIVSTTERSVARWPVGEPVAFAELTHALARDVIVAAVCGVTEPARAQRLQAALDRFDQALNSLELAGRFAAAILMRGWWAPYPRIRSIHAEIDAVAQEEIDARRASGENPHEDCLSRFLEPADPEDALADEEIVGALRVLIVAGWATTANTLAWMAERLTRHPDVLARCVEDARDGSGHYLTAAVQETLRVRPPVPITVRYVAGDFDLNGTLIPKGTVIATDIERMHFRGDVYEDPRAFNPERFLQKRPGTYTWIPFGGGVHRCIGAGFALTEARLVLRTILRRLTFARDTSRGETSRRSTLITEPRRKARVTLTPA